MAGRGSISTPLASRQGPTVAPRAGPPAHPCSETLPSGSQPWPARAAWRGARETGRVWCGRGLPPGSPQLTSLPCICYLQFQLLKGNEPAMAALGVLSLPCWA